MILMMIHIDYLVSCNSSIEFIDDVRNIFCEPVDGKNYFFIITSDDCYRILADAVNISIL